MATYLATQKRRALQKLWNKLDDHLSSRLCDGVILAISGGPDSRALLEAVALWPSRSRGRIVVATIDHGIRKASAAEANFIVMRAKRLGFDTFSTRIQSNSTSEHELRRLRYEALTSCAHEKNCSTIVTAHQSDDNSEGYLMALMGVGGGELGAAMKEVEYFGDYILCRPFLALTKADLLLALSLINHTDFVRDICDERRIGQRAFIRHEVLPTLVLHTPHIMTRLHQFGKAQRQHQDVVEAYANARIRWFADHAAISLTPKPPKALLISALWQIIKRFGDGKDLRSTGALLTSIADEVFLDDSQKNRRFAGLDPRLNGFNLKEMNVKQYQVPGAVVFRAENEIQVRRL